MLTLRFLGTGGARWVTAKQIRSSAGFWLQTGTTNIHVDPGPGALVRALAQVPRCDPATLDAIVLSHKHLDHSGDVNAMIEAMCQGGWKPRGALCAPLDALDPAREPVVLPYARRFVPREWIVDAFGGPFAVGDVELRASLRLEHPVETYGLHFRADGVTVSYVPCTRYFDAIVEDYRTRAPDVLVMNVLRYRDTMDVDHLTFDDARAPDRGHPSRRGDHVALQHAHARARSQAAGVRARRRDGHQDVRRLRRLGVRCRLTRRSPSPASSTRSGTRTTATGARELWNFRVVWHEQSHDLVVRDDGGAVIGALRLRIAASLGHVEALYVLPASRRAGAGRSLLARAEEISNYYNCHKVTASVFHAHAAQAFFEACGYAVEAVLPQHTFKLDVAMMRKFLL